MWVSVSLVEWGVRNRQLARNYFCGVAEGWLGVMILSTNRRGTRGDAEHLAS